MIKHILTSLFIFLHLVVSARVADSVGHISPHTPQPITTASGSQYNAQSLSDGNGGVFVLWENHGYLDTVPIVKVFAQHLDSSGSPLWAEEGVPVSTSFLGQLDHHILSDRAGGLIVTWTQYYPFGNINTVEQTYDVYAQRINSAGLKLWGNNGLAIADAPGKQYPEAIVPYGNNGAFITWAGNGLYATRIDGDGLIQGNPIRITGKPQASLGKIFSADNGEVTLLFSARKKVPLDTAFTSVDDIYIQRLDGSGQALLDTAGTKIYTFGSAASIYIGSEQIVNDANGGIYILFTDEGDSNKLYLQHVLSNGTLAFSLPYGQIVDAQTAGGAMLLSDNAGGVVVGWKDSRSSQSQISNVRQKGISQIAAVDYGFYAQHYNSAGTKLWTNDAVIKPSGVSPIGGVAGTRDQSGNFIFVVSGVMSNGNSLYAQKINSTGIVQWPTDGVLVDNTAGSGYKDEISVVAVNNTINVFWSGINNSQTDLFQQVISPNGTTLPVELSDFNASYSNGKVLLSWKTLSELNNDHFEILKSEDGITFKSIADVAGKGNSTSVNYYTYSDVNISESYSQVYYRLKQVDKNGEPSFSAILTVRTAKMGIAFNVFPNPAAEKVIINVANLSAASYSIADITGKVQSMGSINTQTTEVNLQGLNAGTYFLTVKNASDTYIHKVIKL